MKKRLPELNEKGASKWIWVAVVALVAIGAAVAFPVLNRARLQKRTAMEETSKITKIPIVVPTSMTPESSSAARPEVAPVPGAMDREDEQGATGTAIQGNAQSLSAEDEPGTAAVKEATTESHASGSDSDETEVRSLPANTDGPSDIAPAPIVPPVPHPTARQAIETPAGDAATETAPAATAPETSAKKDETADVTPSGTAPFSVQLGAFHGRANAERLVTRLNGGGYSAFIVEKSGAADQTLYIVRSGHYATLSEAERAATEIWEKENLDGIVIKAP